MRITYDPKYDVLYIKLADGLHKVMTKHLNEDIALDFDEQGKLVGIEILAASEYIDLGSLLPIAVHEEEVVRGAPA